MMLKKIFEAFFAPIGTATIVWQIFGNDLPTNQAVMLTGAVCGIVNLLCLWMSEES